MRMPKSPVGQEVRSAVWPSQTSDERRRHTGDFGIPVTWGCPEPARRVALLANTSVFAASRARERPFSATHVRSIGKQTLSSMQTNLADFIRNTPDGDEADAILRKCVHCGFCTATCPTYQLLGDELDGPRGRIYLIKQMVEGAPVTRSTQQHLDRCLTCRSCETTCPSGVQYGRLVEIGRKHVEAQVQRRCSSVSCAACSRAYAERGAVLAGDAAGQHVRPLLPKRLRDRCRRARGCSNGRTSRIRARC